jgi:hypothetical protein
MEGEQMENYARAENEPKNSEQLLGEMLEYIKKQLDMDMKLKNILESVVSSASRSRGIDLTEESANYFRDLYIEAESLQAEGRAVFHELFGVEEL